LFGKSLGLVGFGQIGQAVARRAMGFNMRILAYDPIQEKAGTPSGLPPIEYVSLDELLEQSDFVSVHAPSLPETRGMFNAERFGKMKPTAYFINTARGPLVDDAALLDALTNNKIADAAIDVYHKEPCPEDHPLRKAPRCLLTPHNAFNAVEAAEAMSRLSAQSVIDLYQGRHPVAVCNPAVWDSPALRVKGV